MVQPPSWQKIDGCKCSMCQVKSVVADLTVDVKPLSEALNEAIKAVITLQEASNSFELTAQPPMYSLEQLKEITELCEAEQEKTDKEWSAWFESLTPFENELLAVALNPCLRATPGYIEYDQFNIPMRVLKFPTGYDDRFWNNCRSVMKQPGAAVHGLARRIPALKTERPYPCSCTNILDQRPKNTIDQIIIHLNDDHKWKFVQVANWLDTLGLDFSFSIPDTITGP